MNILSVLYNSISTIAYTIGSISFGVCYFCTRRKKDFYWTALFLIDLLYEVFGNLCNTVPSLYTTFRYPYVLSVIIMALLTLMYILLISEETGLTVSRGEKRMLLLCSAVVFLLPVFPQMRETWYLFLAYTFYWAVWKTFPIRRCNWRGRITFWASLMIAALQTISLVIVFVGKTAVLLPYVLRSKGSFELLMTAELITMIVLFCAAVDLAANIRGMLQKQPEKTVFIRTPAEVAADSGLTRRESEIFGLLVNGDTTAQISEKLFISEGTVKVHIHNIYQKLGIRSRAQINALLMGKTGAPTKSS